MQMRGITIGIPREIMPGEKRVAADPETVEKMCREGAKVFLEKGAGEGAFFSNMDYQTAGAYLVDGPEELYKNSEVIIKVKEPCYHQELKEHEVDLLREGTYLICFLHPANPINHQVVRKLAHKNILSYTLEGVPRISRAQQMDALTSMSTVAGYRAAISAANHLPRFIPMMPTAFGVFQPANFLVVGTGVVGLQSIGMAKRMGAKVKALDIRQEAQEQAKSLGAEVIPFEVPPELAVGEGGYARRLPEEWYQKERQILEEETPECDAVILTALIPGEQSPILLTTTAVERMANGSVVVDIAVDQGGNCEVVRPGEEYQYQGVTISGVLNIPARLPVDATKMLSQNVWHFLQYVIKEGSLVTDTSDEVIRDTLVTVQGEIVHRGTLLSMGKHVEEE